MAALGAQVLKEMGFTNVTYMDGGMLTGSAYMRKPWGVSEVYSITDP